MAWNVFRAWRKAAHFELFSVLRNETNLILPSHVGSYPPSKAATWKEVLCDHISSTSIYLQPHKSSVRHCTTERFDWRKSRQQRTQNTKIIASGQNLPSLLDLTGLHGDGLGGTGIGGLDGVFVVGHLGLVCKGGGGQWATVPDTSKVQEPNEMGGRRRKDVQSKDGRRPDELKPRRSFFHGHLN